MAEAWTPERVVDAPLAARLVAEQFPDLAGAPVEPFGAGFDNTAFLVAGTWVFRFPRRSVAVPSLEREARLLPFLAPRLPLDVPEPTRIGAPAADFPWPFTGYRLLEGRTACDANLDDATRAASAAALGEFVAALHGIPVPEAAAHGARPDPLGKLDLAELAPRMRRIAAEHAAAGTFPAEVVPLVERVLDDAARATQVEGPVSHGDLYTRHLLVDGRGRLTGVIDWGDAHLCDPGCDLSVAYLFVPRRARDEFRRAYGDVPEDRWRFARLRATFHALATARFCVATGDAPLLRECRWALAQMDA